MITTRPSHCACRNIECTSIRVFSIRSMAAREGVGGGLLPYKRLMGMCRWMGPYFHKWSD